MYRITEEQYEDHQYLILEPEEGTKINEMAKGMLLNNGDKIPGLLSMTYSKIDQREFFEYDITNCVLLKNYYKTMITKKELIQILRNLIESFIGMKSYFLSYEQILLSLEYCYIDRKTKNIKMILIPFDVVENRDLLDFLRLLLVSIRYRPEHSEYVAKIVNYLNREEGFSIEDMNQFLLKLDQKEEKKKEDDIVKKEVIKEDVIPNSYETSYDNIVEEPVKEKKSLWKNLFGKKEKKNSKKKEKKKGQKKSQIPDIFIPYDSNNNPENKNLEDQNKFEPSQSFYDKFKEKRPDFIPEETIDMYDSDDTLDLDDEDISLKDVYLYHFLYNKKITITQIPFCIGRSKENHYIIENNPKVGRKHAQIKKENGKYYIYDNYSKNHVWLNGSQLNEGEMRELHNKDTIRLADEELGFYSNE